MKHATVNLVQLGGSPTMHHVVEPKPLRGTPEEVRTRCGRRGAPRKLVTHVDAKVVRVRDGVVCVNCIDLNRGA